MANVSRGPEALNSRPRIADTPGMNPLLLLVAWPAVLVVSLPFVISVCRASAQAEDATMENLRYVEVRTPASGVAEAEQPRDGRPAPAARPSAEHDGSQASAGFIQTS